MLEFYCTEEELNALPDSPELTKSYGEGVGIVYTNEEDIGVKSVSYEVVASIIDHINEFGFKEG